MLLGVLVPLGFWYVSSIGKNLSPERLTTYLRSGEASKQVRALRAFKERLEEKHPDGTQVLPEVLRACDQPGLDVEVRKVCGWALQVAPHREDVISVLRRFLDDPVRWVRYNAALALAAHDDDSSLPTLRSMLAEPDVRTRREAMKGFYLVGDTDDAELIRGFTLPPNESDPLVRRDARAVLQRIEGVERRGQTP